MLQDIFTQGTLEMSDAPVAAAVRAIRWGDVLSNRILAVVVIGAVLLDLSDLMQIFPKIMDCIRRWKANIGMEHSLSVARSRNISAMIWAAAFCLAADRLDLYPARWMDRIPAGWTVAAMFGIALAYVLVRKILSLVAMPRRLGAEKSQAAHCAIYTYFIAFAVAALCTMGIMMVLHSPEESVRSVILWMFAAFWLLSFVRTAGILASQYGVLTTFLYLCALEILPAGLVVASAVFL